MPDVALMVPGTAGPEQHLPVGPVQVAEHHRGSPRSPEQCSAAPFAPSPHSQGFLFSFIQNPMLIHQKTV